MSLGYFDFILFVSVLALKGPSGLVSGENECLHNSPVVNIQKFVAKEASNSSSISLAQFNCSAVFPIQWTFQTFPVSL